MVVAIGDGSDSGRDDGGDDGGDLMFDDAITETMMVMVIQAMMAPKMTGECAALMAINSTVMVDCFAGDGTGDEIDAD